MWYISWIGGNMQRHTNINQHVKKERHAWMSIDISTLTAQSQMGVSKTNCMFMGHKLKAISNLKNKYVRRS